MNTVVWILHVTTAFPMVFLAAHGLENWSFALQLLVTTIVVILGWFAVHWLSAQRDNDNKRRDMRIGYLLEAYRRLDSASNRPITFDRALRIESACSDIQLLGTNRQIELVQACLQELANTGGVSFSEVLDDLRRELRRQLKLEEMKGRAKILVMHASLNPPQTTAIPPAENKST